MKKQTRSPRRLSLKKLTVQNLACASGGGDRYRVNPCHEVDTIMDPWSTDPKLVAG